MKGTDFSDPNTLFIIRANNRTEVTEDVSFSVFPIKRVPEEISPLSVILVPFPYHRASCKQIPSNISFIAYGECCWIEEAFNAGASDFIRIPMDSKELEIRTERILALGSYFQIPGTKLFLNNSFLHGPKGSVFLNPEEYRFLRILIKNPGNRVSRNAIRRALWPRMDTSSRIVDMVVSRLRKHVYSVSDETTDLQIRSVRGFGYVLVLLHPC